VEGSGIIDGQGAADSKVFPNKEDAQRRIPILIRFERCRDVRLSGLTLIDPAMFATFFACCTDIQIERITVRSRDSAAYGNAFVLAGSRRVSIKDCDADCKDDCIALQTFHPDWPNEDIDISGCRITSRWCAISPTGWSSCIWAGSWKWARLSRSSPRPIIPTRKPCSPPSRCPIPR
jgi:polygalacturonase